MYVYICVYINVHVPILQYNFLLDAASNDELNPFHISCLLIAPIEILSVNKDCPLYMQRLNFRIVSDDAKDKHQYAHARSCRRDINFIRESQIRHFSS